jgi:hypothetical protein
VAITSRSVTGTFFLSCNQRANDFTAGLGWSMSYAIKVAYPVAFGAIVDVMTTSPYWFGWYRPRSRSAIFQIKLAFVCAMLRTVPSRRLL